MTCKCQKGRKNMKNKTNRILALALSVVFTIGFFTGCSDNNADSGDVKTVTIWSSVGSSRAFWERKVEEFNSTIGKEKGIEIVFESSTDAAYAQRVDVAVQTGDLPDIFDAGDLKTLVEKDAVVPLEDLTGMDKLIEQYSPYFEENVNTYQGKTYSLISGVTTRGLVYNKDMFKAAGIVDKNGEPTPPKTFKEMREYAKKLTDTQKKEYGMILPVKWVSWLDSDIISLAMSSTGYPNYDTKTQKYDYSGLKPIVQTYIDMRNDGSVYPGAEGLDNDPARARFAEGGIGMKFAYSFDYGVFTSQFIPGFDWGVAPLPVFDEENCYNQVSSYGWGMRVSKKGVDRLGPDVLGTVMSWWYSDDNYRELYKEGLECCPDYEVIKDIEIDDSKKQWKEFCSMQAISSLAPKTLPKDMSGQSSIREVIVDQIWTNGKSVDILDDYSKVSNDAVKKYKDTHPDVDYSIYDYMDWKPIKR